MKPIKNLLSQLPIPTLAVALAALLSSSYVARAHPYAANVTGTNGSGIVSFVMNEDGAKVTVVYEDGSTNSVFDGSFTVNNGTNLFLLEAGHSSSKIICYKQGNGVPVLISDNAF